MQWKDKIVNYVIDHSGALVGAVIIVVVGFFAARWIGKFVDSWLGRKAMEPPVRMLIARIVRLLVIAFALVIALGTAGANVTALVAGIGVVGVGIGLAMQGVLSNIVAGLTIIFTKPFRVGEYIEVAGVHGQVVTVELVSTTLAHADLSKVVIPNRKIVGEVLHNYGTIRQLDLSVGVSYAMDLNKVLSIVNDILSQNPRVLKPRWEMASTPRARMSVSVASSAGRFA